MKNKFFNNYLSKLLLESWHRMFLLYGGVFLSGCLLNQLYPYENFYVYIIMLLFILCISNYFIKSVVRFRQNIRFLFPSTNECIGANISLLDIEKICSNGLWIPAILTILYFTFIYSMGYWEFNIMGFYIVLVGGTTLFLSFICYRYVFAVINLLFKISKGEIKDYTYFDPASTSWYQELLQLTSVTQWCFLGEGIFYVILYGILTGADYKKYGLSCIPLNITWSGILFGIVLGCPLIIGLMKYYLKQILYKMNNASIQDISILLKTNLNGQNPQLQNMQPLIQLLMELKKSKTNKLELAGQYLSVAGSFVTLVLHINTIFVTIYPLL